MPHRIKASRAVDRQGTQWAPTATPGRGVSPSIPSFLFFLSAAIQTRRLALSLLSGAPSIFRGGGSRSPFFPSLLPLSPFAPRSRESELGWGPTGKEGKKEEEGQSFGKEEEGEEEGKASDERRRRGIFLPLPFFISDFFSTPGSRAAPTKG